MFHKVLFILLLNNIILFVIGYSECDEYIIIVKETCPKSLVPTVKPITLNDIDASCFSSTNLSSYDETNINESYVIKFDYSNSESICVPIMKTMELLSNIIIPDDDPLPANNTHEAMQVGDTGEVKNITKTVTDINMFYVNEVNSDPEFIYNKNDSNRLLQCVYTDNICMNENSVEYNNTVDADDSITDNLTTNTIIAVIKHRSITKPTTNIINNYINNIADFNCTIGDTKTVSDDQIIAVTYDLIKKYNCRSKSGNKLNNEKSTLPKYNLTVYGATDFILATTNFQYTDCGNFDSVRDNIFNIACNANNITGVTVNNVTVDNVDVTNEKFNTSMIWHCELVNLNYTDENIRTFEDFKLFGFQNCVEDYGNLNKSNDVESTVIVFKKDTKKYLSENHTRDEDDSIFISKPLKLQLVSSNYSDKAIILNITKGRFFNLLTNEEEKDIGNHSSLMELKLPNSIHNNTKLNQSGDPLQLDIIFNTENTNQTEPLINKLIETSVNSTKRKILNCMFSSSTANISSPRNETISIFNCKIINLKNASALKDKHDVTDHNLKDYITSTTEKIERNQSTSVTPKTNDEYRTINNTSTTEMNLLGYSSGVENSISPKVIITMVASIIGVVASVGTYAYFLFRRPKYKYEPTATRDWATMDETAF